MKLRRFQIDGFKALDELAITIPRDLLFLIGVNGAGKSSTLQALSFVRAFGEGEVPAFFDDRGWNPGDLRARVVARPVRSGGRPVRVPASRPIAWRLLFDQDGGAQLLWEFTWSIAQSCATRERVWLFEPGTAQPRTLFSYQRAGRTSTEAQPGESIRLEDLRLPGSAMAFLPAQRLTERPEDASHLSGILNWARGITSLELLSPVAMRRSVRGRPKDIGPRGERLTGFIAGLGYAGRQDLVARVQQFYPLVDLDTIRKNAGWIDMRVSERFPNSFRVSPAHMSDGFMRILALCAIPSFDDQVSMVLLDEVEDGIEPHILPKLIQFVASSSGAQFVMTSHSPLLINYFEPDEVCFLTRKEDGTTALAKPAEMTLFIEGAEFFGVGEIWANASSEVVSRAVVEQARDDDEIEETSLTEIDRAKHFASGL